MSKLPGPTMSYAEACVSKHVPVWSGTMDSEFEKQSKARTYGMVYQQIGLNVSTAKLFFIGRKISMGYTSRPKQGL